jgi:hypothetical protein
MVVTPRRIGLPKLDARTTHRRAVAPEHAAAHFDHLTFRTRTMPGEPGQVGILLDAPPHRIERAHVHGRRAGQQLGRAHGRWQEQRSRAKLAGP